MRRLRRIGLWSPKEKSSACSGLVGAPVEEIGSVTRRLSLIGRDNSGSSLVEFALSSVIVVMVLFGIIQCCLALYVNSYISDAARLATRYAVVRGANCSGMPDCGITSAQIQTYLRSIPYPGVNSNNLNASTTWYSASASQPTTWSLCASQCNAPGNAVQVQVTYAFPLNIPFWKKQSITLGSTSQMVISN